MSTATTKNEKNFEEVFIKHSFKKPIDYLVFQLKQQYLNLSDNELKLLALICIKGVSKTIKEAAVREGIFKSKQTVANTLSKFRTLQILDRDNEPVLQSPLVRTNACKLIIEITI